MNQKTQDTQYALASLGQNNHPHCTIVDILKHTTHIDTEQINWHQMVVDTPLSPQAADSL